jgi:hypothetical protein
MPTLSSGVNFMPSVAPSRSSDAGGLGRKWVWYSRTLWIARRSAMICGWGTRPTACSSSEVGTRIWAWVKFGSSNSLAMSTRAASPRLATSAMTFWVSAASLANCPPPVASSIGSSRRRRSSASTFCRSVATAV